MRFFKNIRFLLLPFSLLYSIISSIRNFFYNRGIFKIYKLPTRVISIGNLTWGGTGKTPAIVFISNVLLQHKKRPAILTRGYGSDEEHLLSRLAPEVPIITGRNRVRNALDAISRYSIDTILLDDAFQYRRLKRDLDIVCIDSLCPFGNGLMIPCGSLREGLDSLKRADIILLTRFDLVEDKILFQDLVDRLNKINPHALIVKAIHKVKYIYRLSDNKIVDIKELEDKNIILVSGIGNPDSFEKTVLKLGLGFKQHFAFRDHHHYKRSELEKIKIYCLRNDIDTILTTEKDTVKLVNLSPWDLSLNFLALHIEFEIAENEEGFNNRLLGIYNS